jgi:serine/threonine protein kinase
LVRYLGHGTSPDGSPYLVMEWLDGRDLCDRLHAAGLTAADVIQLGCSLADALAYAHDQGVTHRDIKPANIFLVQDQVARAKLIDFGIAKLDAATRALTGAGMVIGTPGYMAPEQVRAHRDIGPAADLFGLGCVLYECLAGRPAFIGDRPLALLGKILFEEVAPLESLRPELPHELVALVAELLRKDPTQRPASAREVCDRLVAAAARDGHPSPAVRRQPAAEVITGAEQRIVTVVGIMPPKATETPTNLVAVAYMAAAPPFFLEGVSSHADAI